MKIKLANLYLEWVNDFLTVPAFASYHRITEAKAYRIINIGRKCHERRVADYKKQLNIATLDLIQVWAQKAVPNVDRIEFNATQQVFAAYAGLYKIFEGNTKNFAKEAERKLKHGIT